MIQRFTGFGGGHGLYATLRALNHLKQRSQESGEVIDITAIVGVSDNGGSSGRLRESFPIVPPGDLRMALAALCPLDRRIQLSSVDFSVEELLQYRFDPSSDSDLAGHAVGNILLTALWNHGFSTVEGIAVLGSLLNVQGRVLPSSIEPTAISAKVQMNDQALETHTINEIIGQVAVARTDGEVLSIALEPSSPAVSTQVISAIHDSDFLVFGPGSWFTSVVPHLMIMDIYSAVRSNMGRKILVVNLAPQTGETSAYNSIDYLQSWNELATDIPIDVVIADPAFVTNHADFDRAAHQLGGTVLWSTLAQSPQSHDPVLLANAFDKVRAMKRGTAWQ